VTNHGLNKLAACAILACAYLARLEAATPTTSAPSPRVSPDYSIRVQALENYKLVALESVRFASLDSHISPDERTALSALAKRFCQSSEMVFEVRGYADGAASVKQNLAASAERATAVARFLTGQGVPLEQILILGLGEVDPASPVLDPEHQRVDIRIFAPFMEGAALGPTATPDRH
jgi:outer membrane protein OmpA-like peptidoglycan-associated protein